MFDWNKVSAIVITVGIFIGWLLGMLTGAWYTSVLFYRVSAEELKLSQLEVTQAENQKTIANAILIETRLSAQMEGLKELLDRIVTREETNAKRTPN